MSGPTLVPVIAAHRFDESALHDWLLAHLPGIIGPAPLEVQQFQGGQSNPTFLIRSGDRALVLRKRPPGPLLPKAHNIAREYRVLKALGPSTVAVPRMFAFCDDPTVIGTDFYLMDYVVGRVFSHPVMPHMAAAARTDLHLASIDMLAHLHRTDIVAVGLDDFGPHTGYVARQVDRWNRQYQASLAAGAVPAIAWLADWLRERQDVPDELAIVHGDYRHGNLCFHPDRPEIAAIFDWELSTLGHPLADLAYLCMPYHIPASLAESRGLAGLDLPPLGIPEEAEVVARYCNVAGRERPNNWAIFLALSFFRIAAILHGVGARAKLGNASDGNAARVAQRASLLADIGQAIARRAP